MTTQVNYESEVRQIVSDVFESMLRQEVLPLQAPEPASWEIEASVSIQGAWIGSLVLRCTLRQADAWTRKIMSIDNPGQEDLCDAVGEIANMIGGNLKGILPPRNVLSVPNVLFKSASVDDLPTEQINCQSYFRESNDIFTVVLTEHMSD